MPLDPKAPRDSSRVRTRILLAFGFLSLSILGGSIFREDSYLGRQLYALLDPWLSARFGPEGVPAARHLVSLSFSLAMLLAGLWMLLLVWRNLQFQPVWTVTPEDRRSMGAWKTQTRTAGLCLLSAFATIAASLGDGTARSGWLYEHWGPQAPHVLEIAFFSGLTILSGLSFVRQLRRNRAARSVPVDPQ